MQITLTLNLTDKQAEELFAMIKDNISKAEMAGVVENQVDLIDFYKDISVRTANLFRVRGIKYYSQLTAMSKGEFLRYKGFGTKCLIETLQLLESKGLMFKG